MPRFFAVLTAGLMIVIGGGAFAVDISQRLTAEGMKPPQCTVLAEGTGNSSVHQGKVAETPSADCTVPRHSVVIYTTSWCHFCHDAKAYLKKRGIAYTEYDVEKDAEALRRRNELSPGGGVPIAVIDGKVVRGFSAELYDPIFGKAP